MNVWRCGILTSYGRVQGIVVNAGAVLVRQQRNQRKRLYPPYPHMYASCRTVGCCLAVAIIMTCFAIASKVSRKAPIDIRGSSWRFGMTGKLSGLRGVPEPPSIPDSDPKMNGHARTDWLWSRLQGHFAATYEILGPRSREWLWDVLNPCK